MKYVAAVIVVALLAVVGLALTKPSSFTYEQSGVINASADKIFPYLRDFKKGAEWSPWEKMDPEMKKTYSGPEAGVGAAMEFVGKKETGSGKLEITNETPNEMVEVRLDFTKPFTATSVVRYTLTPEQEATRFTWTMTGQNNFMGKLMMVFMDCEKMMKDEFAKGIQNLKGVVEGQSPPADAVAPPAGE